MVDPDQAEALMEVFLQEGLLGACQAEFVIHTQVNSVFQFVFPTSLSSSVSGF